MGRPLADRYPAWVPFWLRRLHFRFFPGRWTQAEVDDIYRRAREMKRELDALTD